MGIEEKLNKTRLAAAKVHITDYVAGMKEALSSLPVDAIAQLVEMMLSAYERGAGIFIMGNGGSAATASHIVVDINKGVSYGLEKRFKMICLNDNVPSVMAYANDLSYEDIFVEQLKNFLEPRDLVIGISGSGNSQNVLKAIAYANRTGAATVGLSGFDGGKLATIANLPVVVRVFDMQKSEDLHMMIGHIMMQFLAERLHSLNDD